MKFLRLHKKEVELFSNDDLLDSWLFWQPRMIDWMKYEMRNIAQEEKILLLGELFFYEPCHKDCVGFTYHTIVYEPQSPYSALPQSCWPHLTHLRGALRDALRLWYLNHLEDDEVHPIEPSWPHLQTPYLEGVAAWEVCFFLSSPCWNLAGGFSHRTIVHMHMEWHAPTCPTS
jgi:hypothetical protein